MRSRNPPDYVFLAITGALILFGLAALASASGPTAYVKFKDSLWFVKHQLLYGVLPGTAVFLFFYAFDYRRLRALAFPLILLTVGLLVLVFIPGFGAQWGTSRSWLDFGGVSLQPGEIAKLTLLVYLAAWLEARGEHAMKKVATGLIPFLVTIGIVAGLLIMQPDIGTMMIVAATSLVMYFLGGGSLIHLAGIVLAGLAGVFALVKAAPYRLARLTTFLDPSADPRGVGYHINQAFVAIGSGGLFGLGYGRSRQKYLYLPEVAGDSIFAVIVEELGFLAASGLVLLFLAFIYRGVMIARAAPDRFGTLLVSGIVAWIGIQAVVNIGAMVGVLPLTGLTLPFVSYGGTSMLVTLAAVGIVANVSRQSV